jgi:hypothetical protein
MSAELDRQVACIVLGWQVYHYNKGPRGSEYYMLVDEHFDAMAPGADLGERKTEKEAWDDVPRFSEDLSTAWRLVEHIGHTWRDFEFAIMWNQYTQKWQAGWWEVGYDAHESRCTGQSDQMAEAICLAALEVRKAEAR